MGSPSIPLPSASHCRTATSSPVLVVPSTCGFCQQHAQLCQYSGIHPDCSRTLHCSSADWRSQRYSAQGLQPAGLGQFEAAAEAEGRLQEIIENRPKKGFKEVNALLKEAVERLDELFKNDADITGLSTGFKDLDNMTSGWQRSDLVLWLRVTSWVKPLCHEYGGARHSTRQSGAGFLPEMPASQLVMRLLSSIGKLTRPVCVPAT